MEKYKKDCNGDGFITCEDYAAIHRRGPRACSNKDLLRDNYWNKFLACRANQKPIKDVNMVKVSNSIDDTETQSPLANPGDILFGSIVSSTTTPPPTIETAQNSSEQSSSSSTTLLHSTSSASSERFDYSPTPNYELTSIMNAREDSPTRKPIAQALERTHINPQKGLSQVQNNEFVKSEEQQQQNLNVKPNLILRPMSVSSISTHYESTSDDSDHYPTNSMPPVMVPTSSNWLSANLPTTKSAPQIFPVLSITTTSSAHLSQTQPTAARQNSQVDSHDNRNEAHHVIAQKTDHQTTNNLVQSTFPSVDQPLQAQSIYADKIDFPYLQQENSNSASRPNFDEVVIGIVGNPNFPKSYPPVPEFVLQEKQTDPVQEPPLTSKSQQKITTNHSRNPNQASKISSSQSTNQVHSNESLLSQKAINRGPPSESNVSQAQHNTAMQQHQQQEKRHEIDTSSVIPPMFGAESLNVSGMGLNESSRIASECLECICDASSNCDTTVQCISKQREKNRCGLYMISWNQYQESDISLTSLVTVPTGMSEETTDEKMYYECTTDKVCAEKLIHLYIEKHQKDCNNDGKIDCYDIAALHRVGPDNCNSGKFLNSQYWRDFNICYTTDRLTTTTQPQPSSQLNL